MKKLIYTLMLLPLVGCNDFLDEVDQDKLIPEKTDHYSALLLEEFNNFYPMFRTVDYMTDNISEIADATGKQSAKTTYTWQREVEIDEDGERISSINSAWENMYEDIAIANYVIELVDEALGSEQEIDFIKGEAYFVRAYSYFNLLNLYGQPYDPATAATALGVPLRDDIGVEIAYNRNTVAECYELIESDLLKAIELISASGIEKTVWHPNDLACKLLMSRVKLYQEKWDEAIAYSNEVIAETSLTKMNADVPFIRENNNEIIYSCYASNPLFKLYDYGTVFNTVSYEAANELVALYDEGDVRKEAFFAGADNGTGKLSYRTKKYELGLYTELGFVNFRASEAFLNRAEAYAQKGDVSNAINDIRDLQSKRYSDVSLIDYPTEASDVLALVLTERRKELCFEDHHRWFDLRRMANRPEIKHVYTIINENGVKVGSETYTLLSDDLNYTLPIPLKERENNPLIRNNERYEKIPVIEEEIIVNKPASN